MDNHIAFIPPPSIFDIMRFLWRLILKDCLHGGGGPHIGQVTCGGHPTYISCKRDQIKMRDYMDRGLPLGLSRLCSATFEQLLAFGATLCGSSRFCLSEQR